MPFAFLCALLWLVLVEPVVHMLQEPIVSESQHSAMTEAHSPLRSDHYFLSGQQGGSVVHTITSQHEGHRFESRLTRFEIPSGPGFGFESVLFCVKLSLAV